MGKGDDITTRFRVDVSDLKRGISEANQQIKLANAEFKAAAAGMDNWKDSADGIQAKLNQLDSVLTAQKKKLDAYRQEIERTEKAQEENGKRADELKQSLAEMAEGGVDKASAEYKALEKELTACEKAEAANQKSLDGLRVTMLNQQAAVNSTEKDIRQYDQALAEVTDESKRTGAASDVASKGIQKVGNSSSESKPKVSELATKMGEGLVDGATKATAALSAAAGAVYAFGVKGATAADDIITLSKITGLNTEQLQKYSYVADLVDVSMEDLVKSLAKTSKTMGQADGDSKKVTEAYEELGVSVKDSNGQMRDNEDVFTDIINALGKMTNETKRDQIAMTIFGKSAQALNPLIETGMESLKGMTDEAEGLGLILGGDALDSAGAFDDGIQKIKATVNQTSMVVASKLAPVVVPAMEAIQKGIAELASKIGDIDPDKLGMVAKITGITIAGTALTAVIGKIALTLGGAVSTVSAMRTAMVAAKASTDGMSIGMAGLNAAMNANPAALVATALGTLATVVIPLIATTTANATTEAEKNAEAAREQADAIKAEGDAFLELQSKREETVAGDQSQLDRTKQLKDELLSLADSSGKVKEKDQARAQFILGQLNEALGTEYSMTDGVIQKKDELAKSTEKLIEKKKLELQLQAYESEYTEAVKKRGEAEKQVSQTYGEAVTLRSKLMSDEIKLEKLRSQGVNTANQAEIAGLQRKVDAEREAFTAKTEAYNQSKTNLQNYYVAIEGYENANEAVISGNSKKAQNALDGIGNSTSKMGQKFRTHAKESSDELVNLGNTSQTQGKKIGDKLAEGVEKGAKKVPQKIRDQKSGAQTAGKEVGEKVGQGVESGINGMLGQVAQKAAEMVEKAKQAAKKKAGIKSPSRLFRDEVGEPIAQGMAVGIANGTKSYVASATTGMVKQSLATAKQGVSDMAGIKSYLGQSVGAMSPTSTAADGQAVTNQPTSFTQIINAPKTPTRIELYRQTKNLLALRNGVI